MDGNVLKEIHYLTRLIEQHKKKLPQKMNHIEKALPNQDLHFTESRKLINPIQRCETSLGLFNKGSDNSSYVKCQLTSTNVYVNPNFRPKNPMIHINPKVCAKPLIHVNPKMMKEVTNPVKKLDNETERVSVQIKPNVDQIDVKRSVYVNPKLMKKLTDVPHTKPLESKPVVQEPVQPVCSRLKLIKSTNETKATPKKNNNSSVLILSRRKLIRVRRNSKGSPNIPQMGTCKVRKPLVSPFKKSRISPQKFSKTKLVNVTQQPTSNNVNLTKSQILKPSINKYRIDRTVSPTAKIKKSQISGLKKSMNKKLELVTISGIVYKTSKNQLVRRSYSLKKKRTSNVKPDKFIITPNGKKLRRLKPTKETEKDNSGAGASVPSGTKQFPTVSSKFNYKHNIRHDSTLNSTFINIFACAIDYESDLILINIFAFQKSDLIHFHSHCNKVKQRSIQILCNKMKKNNQPCLIFQRFGYCANNEKGTCPKLHDKRQVSLCKKFLQGNCLLDNCPLSHNVGPEKMPTCKYFLDGCCTRDACPYRHVKCSSKTPVCIEFLKGYCEKGHECNRRHEYLCPEFEKLGKCSKGKYCPYPHKTQAVVKKTDKYLKRKHEKTNTEMTSPTKEDNSSSSNENRLRYYEQADTLTEDLEKKRENIMKKMKIMRSVEMALHSAAETLNDTNTSNDSANSSEIDYHENEVEIICETKQLKRPPIGSLPAYIPIN